MGTCRISGRASAPALALSLILSGCSGDPGRVAAVPASGTVTLKGQPLASGNIQFIPSDGRPASGAIKDGAFTLTTYEGGDGALPGRHAVSITSFKDIMKPGMTEPEQQLVTPKKYSTPESSGIVIEIPPGGKTDIVIPLD